MKSFASHVSGNLKSVVLIQEWFTFYFVLNKTFGAWLILVEQTRYFLSPITNYSAKDVCRKIFLQRWMFMDEIVKDRRNSETFWSTDEPIIIIVRESEQIWYEWWSRSAIDSGQCFVFAYDDLHRKCAENCSIYNNSRTTKLIKIQFKGELS